MAINHPIIETERFTLKPMTQADAPLLAALGADPNVVKTLICDWSQPERRLHIAHSWIKHNQEHGIWAVLDRDGRLSGRGRFVGFCAVDEPLPLGGQGPEIYYAFATSTWGQGVASETVEAVIAHVFAAQGVEAIEALVLAGLNAASVKLAEKLGMRLVGRYPIGDYVATECRPTMDFEVWRVRTASPERAQPNLQEAAFKIGQFLATGVATKDKMTTALRDAAQTCGLSARVGDDVVRDLIDERLTAGMAEDGWLHFRVEKDRFFATRGIRNQPPASARPSSARPAC